ncbi:hypothetical protein [Parafilimonas terrae]|uniref:HEAT repeat-containing protein n=1 Tax=Parafilimonas terrae TaxID=1465490 RepID=A0A1I5U3X6_9BACT|nr:hypothetical protein [Parafilimonas terrae]SFP89931.1 hypothetical protein SAMN05444277_10349 [Parafilimonas terrae]
MNIREALLKEKDYNKEQALKITAHACSSPAYFKELMQFFLSGEYRLAQRAAWSVSRAATQNPELIKPYIKNLVEILQRKNIHDAVIRNSVRILQQVEIPEALHGELMNSCFEMIEQPSTPVAIKAFSLTALYNLSKYYPEIKNELKLIIETNFNNETAAFKSRGKLILKKLDSNG